MTEDVVCNKDWHEYSAGGLAAFVNILCTFPAYKLMIRQQVTGVGVFTGFRELKKEGIFKLYRGVGPPLIQKSASLSIMFGSYHSVQKNLAERYPEVNSLYIKLISGLIAGSIESLLTPFERMQTMLSLSEHKDYTRVQNTVHAFLKIKKHYNFKEYYRGFTAILLRNGPSTALYFFASRTNKIFFSRSSSSLSKYIGRFY